MDIGKILVVVGIFFIVLGIVTTLSSNISSFPKLPGDIYIKKGNFTFYFPWVTTLIASIIISLLLNFLNRR